MDSTQIAVQADQQATAADREALDVLTTERLSRAMFASFAAEAARQKAAELRDLTALAAAVGVYREPAKIDQACRSDYLVAKAYRDANNNRVWGAVL